MQKIVVSLTSYPERIYIVKKVIQSLWVQTVLADEIILYLSLMEFPQKEKDLPIELTEMIGKNGFRLEWVGDNLKSHKKYFYALQSHQNDIVITVDDDVIYAETMISDLINSYRTFPKAISTRRARIVIKERGQLAQYKDWDWFPDEYAGKPRTDLCAIGVGGVLYPPLCAASRWFDTEKIRDLSENQDDLWLKFNEIIDKIPVVYVRPEQRDIPIAEAGESTLYTRNGCGGENDVCIDRLRLWFQETDLKGYSNWFADLMRIDDYISGKKNYYYNIIKPFSDEFANMPMYLYGAGKKTRIILRLLADIGMMGKLEGILVSDKLKNPDKLEGIKVKQINEMDRSKPFKVIYGVGKAYQSEVDNILRDYNCKCINFNVQGLIQLYYGE